MRLAMPDLRKLAPGVLVATALGLAAFFIAKNTPAMSPLVWALLGGAVLGNLARLPAATQPGIVFAAKQILRLGVGLLGVRLAVGQIIAVGPLAAATVVLIVIAGYFATALAGRRLGLSGSLATLLAAGTSICGAAAIAAVAGVVHPREEETAVALATVTLLGTIGILVYPFAGHLVGLDAPGFGLWAGASIHEVAQVVAAASAFAADNPLASQSGDAGAVGTATVVKLGRVLLLAPMMVVLAWSRRDRGARASVFPVPWFIALFIAMVALKSSGFLPEQTAKALVTLDTVLLSIAMAGLGLDLRWAKIRAAGLKPIYAGVAGWTVMSLGTLAAALALY